MPAASSGSSSSCSKRPRLQEPVRGTMFVSACTGAADYLESTTCMENAAEGRGDHNARCLKLAPAAPATQQAEG
jgi:hypothetical protein